MHMLYQPLKMEENEGKKLQKNRNEIRNWERGKSTGEKSEKDEEKLKENNTMWVQFICQMSTTMRYNVTLRGFYDASSYLPHPSHNTRKKRKLCDPPNKKGVDEFVVCAFSSFSFHSFIFHFP